MDGPVEPGSAKEDPLNSMESNQPADPQGVEIAPSAITELHLADYVQAHLSSPASWAELGSETRENLIQLIVQIADAEGPVHQEVVVERLRQCYGLGRVKGSTREHVKHALALAQSGGHIRSDGTFIWLRDEQMHREPRRPGDGNIEHVPPTELRAIVYATAKAVFGSPRRELVVETARKLGFSKTGRRITEVLDIVIQELLEEERLSESFGIVHAID